MIAAPIDVAVVSSGVFATSPTTVSNAEISDAFVVTLASTTATAVLIAAVSAADTVSACASAAACAASAFVVASAAAVLIASASA